MAIVYISFGLLSFLGGLRLMTAGLEHLGGTSFALSLHRWTGNRFSAFACGVIFSGLTQSSSLATVMVVGVVDAGLISLGPAIAVIIGANVGTTVTSQLLSFSLQKAALPVLAAGLATMAFLPGGRMRQAGRALAGLGLLLYGLLIMSAAMAPLAAAPWLGDILRKSARHPLLGIMTGMAATALVQSSSAVVGMTLLLARDGVLTLSAGISVIIGADVGTCVTAMLAGFASGAAAKRAALAHLLFNVFSVGVVLLFFQPFVSLSAYTAAPLPRQLANAHTLYNLSGALILLVFLQPYTRLIECLTGTKYTKRKRIFDVFNEYIARWF